MSNTFHNLVLVNTRPAHQAETLNKLLKKLGAKIINFPTLDIKGINTAQVQSLCQNLKVYDIAIFVSANAAHYSHHCWPLQFPISIIISVGPSTKKTLENYGLSNIILPQQFNTEGILDLKELGSIQNKKIILFCGKNSRPLLQESLTQRQAKVKRCECYERCCPQPDSTTVSLLKNIKIDGIISTSQASLNNLNHLLENNRIIKTALLIVINSEMKNFAKAHGWNKTIVAANATDEAVVTALAQRFHVRS